jgi:hypothetical protein
MIAHVSGIPVEELLPLALGRHRRPPRGQGLTADADSRENEAETSARP